MDAPIYLDHHASTPLDPRVLDAMLPSLREDFANPSSRQHAYGVRAAARLEVARAKVAEFLGTSDPREVIFTSGATESDNLALLGLARWLAKSGGPAPALAVGRRGHIITSRTEHPAVLDACALLETEGFRVTYLPVDPGSGCVRVEDVEAALSAETVLVSIMYVNNEIGAVNPVAEIGRILRPRGIFFHCDAVQGLAYFPCRVDELGVDLLSISAHKIYGPKGIGALYVRRRRPRVRLEPILVGGGQERGLRPGTLNVPGAVGLAAALECSLAVREEEAQRVGRLRDRLWTRLREALPRLELNGSFEARSPANLNVSLPGLDAARLLARIPELAASSGSACAAGAGGASHVLSALGPGAARDFGGLRFGIGRSTTEEEIDRTADLIARAAGELEEEGDGAAQCSGAA